VVGTEGRVTAGNGRHDRSIVTGVPDVKGSHASAPTLHGIDMEAGCIQDGRRVTEQVGRNCCCCSLDGIRRRVNTSPVPFPRYAALRENLSPCSESET
jgi:hypothetical protein